MTELLIAIAYLFQHWQPLIDAFGDEWVHGAFDEDHHKFPRVAYGVTQLGPQVKNTGSMVMEHFRIRFQTWTTDDITSATLLRLLVTTFGVEFGIRPVNGNGANLMNVVVTNQDSVQEPGPPDPVAGILWQSLVDIECDIQRARDL